MTVSRAMNNEDLVRRNTRDRVKRAIADLGYVPNSAARALAGRRQLRVALLYSNPSSSYLCEFLVGSVSGAAQSDAQIVIEQWSDGESVDTLARRLLSQGIDAVSLPPPLCEHADLLAALTRAKIPVAQVAAERKFQSDISVGIDDAAAAQAMTKYLIDLGHKRIGFVRGNSDQSASKLRLSGYKKALRDAALPLDPELIASGDFTYRSGIEAATRLLALRMPPTAIFAANDDMAAAVVALAHRMRLDVPGDLSVCGYDDTAAALTVWPELTTIRQPITEMAGEGIRMVVQTIGSETTTFDQRKTFDFELIVRGSSGPPRVSQAHKSLHPTP